MRKWRRALAATLCAGIAAIPPAAAARDTLSAWSEGEVSVDGIPEDWRGMLVDLGRSGLRLGIRNDDRFLYLCLNSSDPRMATRVLLQGLTVQFGNRADDSLRIRYPLGIRDAGPLPGTRPDPDRVRRAKEESGDTMIVHPPGTIDEFRMALDSGLGITVAMAETSGFTYEMRVPLGATAEHPHALGLVPGDRVLIRIDTPRTEHPGHGAGAGSRGGVGGRPPGGMGGRRPPGTGERPDPPEPIHARVRVRLAAGPSDPAS